VQALHLPPLRLPRRESLGLPASARGNPAGNPKGMPGDR